MEEDQSIEKADACNAKRHETQIASQNAIAAPLNRLDDKFGSYQSKYDEAERSKRRRDIAGLIGVYLSAFLVLATAIIFYYQLLVFEKTDKTTREALLAGHRPWIKIDFVLDGPLTVDAQTDFAFVKVKYIINNIGNVPATSIRIADRLSTGLAAAKSIDLPDATSTIEKLFAAQDRPDGVTLFPGEPPPETVFGSPATTAKKIRDAASHPTEFFAQIVGCVGYLSASTGDFHETEFWGQLDLIGSIDGGFPKTLADGGRIERVRMSLHKTVFGGRAK